MTVSNNDDVFLLFADGGSILHSFPLTTAVSTSPHWMYFYVLGLQSMVSGFN